MDGIASPSFFGKNPMKLCPPATLFAMFYCRGMVYLPASPIFGARS